MSVTLAAGLLDSNSCRSISRGWDCPCISATHSQRKGLRCPDTSKLLSSLLSLVPCCNCLFAEKICLLGLLFTAACTSLKCSGRELPCSLLVVSECYYCDWGAGGGWWGPVAELVIQRVAWMATNRAAIPARSKCISWCYNHGVRADNYSLFWRMPLVRERWLQ